MSESEKSSIGQFSSSKVPYQQPSNSECPITNNLVRMTPEKESISFKANLVGAPVEVENLIEHIRIVAEQFLYHWKTLPICTPLKEKLLNYI